jgi:uncharacterized membrane protein SirB2
MHSNQIFAFNWFTLLFFPLQSCQISLMHQMSILIQTDTTSKQFLGLKLFLKIFYIWFTAAKFSQNKKERKKPIQGKACPLQMLLYLSRSQA